MESVKNLIDGIKFYVQQQMSKASFDKTDTGLIKGVSEFGYLVEYNGKIYEDVDTIGGTCALNETVKVLIPQGNYNNMFILKSVETNGTSGAVSSVNGQTGNVVLSYADVGASSPLDIVYISNEQINKLFEEEKLND